MKQVYNKSYNGKKKVRNIDKNAIARYILLGFFAFVLIGSILGIIAFARTNKKESAFNVVSANADFSGGFDSFNHVNLLSTELGTSYTYEDDEVQFEFKYQAIREQKVFSIRPLTNYYTRTIYPICPLDFLFDYTTSYDNVFNEYSYFIAFKLYTDTPVLVPSFSIRSMTTNGNVFISSFASKKIDDNNYIYYTYLDQSLAQNFYFAGIYDGFPSANAYLLYSMQIQSMPSFEDESPTSSELENYFVTYINEVWDEAYNEGYNEGLAANDVYDLGFDEGYEMGKNATLDYAKGVFRDAYCTVSVESFTKTGENYQGEYEGFTLKDIPVEVDEDNYVSLATFINRGLDFYGIKGAYNRIAYYSQLFTFTFNFENDKYVLKDLDFLLYGQVATSSTSGIYDWYERGELIITAIDSNGIRVPAIVNYAGFENNHAVSFDVEDLPYRYVSQLEIKAYGIHVEYGPMMRLHDRGADFSLGYDTGYDNGYLNCLDNLDKELNDKYKLGYEFGLKEGERLGYNKGISDANEYTFTALIGSVVDVPIKAFTSLFNFEILGINLANFFFALLTMCIVLAVIKLLI